MSQNELYHHGIDGQRWGVRHGPPYPLDRADHNKVVEKSEKASKKRHLSYSGSRKYAKRMSDKDLNDTIDRLQREETYRRLVSKEKADKKAAKAAKKAKKEEKIRYENQNELAKKQQQLQRDQFEEQKRANGIVRKVITNLLTAAATTAGTEITKGLTEEYFGDKKKEKEKDKTENTTPKEEKPKGEVTSPKAEELKKNINELENRKKEIESSKPKEAYQTPAFIIDEQTKTTAPADFSTWLNMDNRKREAAKHDIPNMSEAQINQAIIDMYPYDIYLSDESEGVCV